jgi:hypothetical protein
MPLYTNLQHLPNVLIQIVNGEVLYKKESLHEAVEAYGFVKCWRWHIVWQPAPSNEYGTAAKVSQAPRTSIAVFTASRSWILSQPSRRIKLTPSHLPILRVTRQHGLSWGAENVPAFQKTLSSGDRLYPCRLRHCATNRKVTGSISHR